MIKPLTSLRFFFALFVFLSHLYFLKASEFYIDIFENFFSEGFLGVSFFFILSGFILAYNYEDKILESLQKEAASLMVDWPSSRNKQKRFVLAYIANGFTNASEAARRAGYSEKNVNKTAYIYI